ncbi:hypothetical protein RMATCC62417_12336 [Rhizopus microsporus]|nr:hypothetical protein RMATCC62417_12336 [Rhizopus microsporus]
MQYQHRSVRPTESTSTSSFGSQSTATSALSRSTIPIAESTLRRRQQQQQQQQNLSLSVSESTCKASDTPRTLSSHAGLTRRATHIPAPSTTVRKTGTRQSIIPQRTKSTTTSNTSLLPSQQQPRSLSRMSQASGRASHIPTAPRSTTSLGIASTSSPQKQSSIPQCNTRSKPTIGNSLLSQKRSEEQQRQDELEVKYLQVKQEMETVLEQQKREYENKIKRISAHLPPGTTLSSDDLLIGYTSKNASEYLVKKTLAHWRQWRYVKMAEGCLVHAVVLKEANIMAKELGKNVTYQFTVVHDNMSASPVSFWEASSALQPFEREIDDALMEEPKPCLAVQVIDHMHRVTYIWSIANIKNRLRSMRQLYDYTDRPLFTHPHFFHRDDPFYETPCPRYSLIGFARIPLRNLTLQLHADNLVDIYCRNTGKVMGQLRVLVTPIARSISRRSFKQAQERSLSVVSEKYLLHIGQQQVFEIRIQEVIGISESDFTQVHAQFHLSSFGNVEPNSREDKIYPTEPISQFGDGPVKFDHCQTLSIHITEKMMGVILDEGLTIEVFGQAQEDYLYQLVDMPPQTGAMTDIPVSRRFSLDRRFSLEKSTYDGILMEERHDVLAWIQIAELDSEGNYAPVPVTHDPMEAFSLRQGIQRRISLTLVHDSGNQFQWKNISCLKIGQVRLVDQQGRLLETTSAEPVEIQLFPQTGAELDKSGISRMMAQGPWDIRATDALMASEL